MWYVYDGTIWQADTGGLKIAELGKLLADKLYVFAITIREEDVRKRFIDRVKKLQQRKHRETMIKDAMSVYPVNMKYFDQDIYLFNCQNGTLDLRTMEFRNIVRKSSLRRFRQWCTIRMPSVPDGSRLWMKSCREIPPGAGISKRRWDTLCRGIPGWNACSFCMGLHRGTGKAPQWNLCCASLGNMEKMLTQAFYPQNLACSPAGAIRGDCPAGRFPLCEYL